MCRSGYYLIVFLILNVGAYAQSGLKSERIKLDSLLKRRSKCNLSGKKISLKNFEGAGDDAFGYSYYYPKNFREVVNKNVGNIYDTTKYISPDKKCTLKLWPGKTISFPLGAVDKDGKLLGLKSSDIIRAENVVDRYIDSIKNGKIKEVAGIRIIEFCKGISGYNFQFSLKGFVKNHGYIYKIVVSELPVSGDLIFKYFLYEYPLNLKLKYEQIGIAIANDFGDKFAKL